MSGKANVTDYLQAALKGASLRQAVIANNIANLNTPGYRRRAVAFEKSLAEEGMSEDLSAWPAY